jgi:hypothetical protein
MKKAIDRRQFGIGGATAAALAAGSRARAQSGPLKFRIGCGRAGFDGPFGARKKRAADQFRPLLCRGSHAVRRHASRYYGARGANSTLDRWRFRHSALPSRMRIWMTCASYATKSKMAWRAMAPTSSWCAARSKRSRISRAKCSPPTPWAARSILPCARCSAAAGLKPTGITPLSRRRSRP